MSNTILTELKRKRCAGLSRTAQLILVIMADYANERKGHTWPSVDTLCYRLDCDRRTVQRAIHTLRKGGYLIPCENINGGRGRVVSYQVCIEPEKGGTDAAVSPVDNTVQKPVEILERAAFLTKKGGIPDRERAAFLTEKGGIPDRASYMEASLSNTTKQIEAAGAGKPAHTTAAAALILYDGWNASDIRGRECRLSPEFEMPYDWADYARAQRLSSSRIEQEACKWLNHHSDTQPRTVLGWQRGWKAWVDSIVTHRNGAA